jgi:plasmid stability protein
MASVNLKNIPDHLHIQLRERARRNHRSLQKELLAILEESVQADARHLHTQANLERWRKQREAMAVELTPEDIVAAINAGRR